MNEYETHAEIIAEMRAPHDEICEKCHEEPNESCPFCGDPDGCNSPDYGRWPGVMIQFADRLEAAHKREVESVTNCNQLNTAKLREALTKCYQLAYEWEANEREGIAGVEPGAKDSAETLFDIQQITTAALAAPARNCDVGTAREQERRHKEEVCPKSACPKHEGFVSNACKGCFAMWSQMPYEEGGAERKAIGMTAWGWRRPCKKLVPWWKDLKRSYPEVDGSTFYDEFLKFMAQIRKRIKKEGGKMRGGRFTHPKLKKIDSGEYMFAGYFHILCHGYNRIVGHVVWSVTNEEGQHVVNAESLTEAVRKLEKILENAVKPQCSGVYA